MEKKTVRDFLSTLSAPKSQWDDTVTIRGNALNINDVVRVARCNTKVQLTDDEEVLRRINASHDYIVNATNACQPINGVVSKTCKPIYGVTTGFGGMAHTHVSPEDASDLQQNLIWFMKSEAGRRLPRSDVRAAMLIRANNHMLGFSGLRLELVQRMVRFLNTNVTPHLREFGSIGVSGDLAPLASITGALIGLDESFVVDFAGEEIDSISALKRLGLPRLNLLPKEGLAMINGTCVMTGIAAQCVYDAQLLLKMTMGTHALFIQGLNGSNQPFHPFIHTHKPHPGQRWVANSMLELLKGSKLIRDELEGRLEYRIGELVQDRYSVRCLPQYMGPLVEGMDNIAQQVTTEINSASDNPLIDPDKGMDYHGGNFLGQYIGVAMDQLRYYLGLMAKHLDVQIALLVTPEFSNGLPPCLIGNTQRTVNMGLKGLQISGNSIMPLLTFYGHPLIDRFPTHAEQFNQNISSLGHGSAHLARQSIEAFQQYMAIALMFGIQAVDLRTYIVAGHYDARSCLAPASLALYEAVRKVVERPPSSEKPYIRNDNEQSLDEHIQRIAADIAVGGRIPQAVAESLCDSHERS
ncbi:MULTISPECIES: HAL/PAL/TAL family ammonia-lyase [Nitrosomonas]|uniref:Histidine ammonia-lyase n=1 Tax=Nitrosomonas communis TaxID=44574 RepID=A0A0F7KFN6_9PROT|nr:MULTISPECIES: aromatic amino acid ammonia-lyase [Nitrosomonas]AKH37637.1 histidine ammonia-lyase [Nitrosomonas communis]TYP81862.1 phenylalanine ammonia-lyase [Nitrosomonas communis]UVS62934.1 aromatic amino acid ammonia-lyase [Nitrosomonas sp. PLL12]